MEILCKLYLLKFGPAFSVLSKPGGGRGRGRVGNFQKN